MKNLKNWENEGFKTVKNSQLFRTTVARLRECTAPTTFQWVKEHSSIEGNKGADKLAALGCEKPEGADLIDMHIDQEYLLPGAKLASITQSTAYKIIQQSKMDTAPYQESLDRYKMHCNMIYAQDAAIDLKGETPSPRQVWKGARHKDFSRSVCFFMWMLINDSYKVGKYWQKIPGSELRATCDRCGVEETMNHILTECQENGQELIWTLASEVWSKQTGQQLCPLIGEIMACGVIKRVDKGTSRLYQILVSESAHLSWLLRNERRIQGKDPAPKCEIYRRWQTRLNVHLAIDCQMTNKGRYEKKAIPKSLILKTWGKVIQDKDTLPTDFTGEPQVLSLKYESSMT